MPIRFTADEVYEMADRIEKNGVRFYRRLSEIFTKDEDKKVLLKLASMEEEHQRIFAIMRSELTPEEKARVVFDPDGQTNPFLHALADGAVFTVSEDPAKAVTGKERPVDLLKIALGMEKDSIVFYTGMKEVVPARLGVGQLDEIIREEMNHMVIIGREMKTLTR